MCSTFKLGIAKFTGPKTDPPDLSERFCLANVELTV